MKKVVVLISDENYLEHTKSLFYALKNKGNWLYDFCLIANNVPTEKLTDFKTKGVEIIDVKIENPYYAKFYLFQETMKRWDYIYYLDCDFVVFDDLQKITYIDNDKILVDIEPFKLHQSFCQGWNENEKWIELNKFSNDFNFNVFGVNTGFMLIPTSLIQSETFDNLIELKNKLQYINNHTKDGGTEQPIINLYFQNSLYYIKNNEVCFWKQINDNTILGHFCRWEAPWNNQNYSNKLSSTYIVEYEKNLVGFKNF